MLDPAGLSTGSYLRGAGRRAPPVTGTMLGAGISWPLWATIVALVLAMT